MNDLISVIVPIYNSEKYLNKCIESIVNNTYNNLEILLIDDGSLDNSPKICDEWEKKDKRIKVIHKNNGGVSSARNEGIKYASGKYISFIDSDDYIDVDMYEFLLSKIKENNSDISICSTYDVINEKVSHNKKENIEIVMNNIEAIINIYKKGYYGNGLHNKLFNFKLIKNNLFPIGIRNGEEILVLFKAFREANTVVYSSIPKYYYVNRENSATKKFVNDNVCQNILKLIEENKDFIDSSLQINNYVYHSYCISLFQLYNHCILYNDSNKKIEFAKSELKKYKNKIIYKNLSISKCFQLKMFYLNIHFYDFLLKIYKIIISLKEKEISNENR